ncbi:MULTISPECIES: hypothetical protein [Bacillus]|uniref:hypothetical protein n=1 Tax=Bacillus TaxID=1386 RepID=UPI0002F5F346|nr:MULTISPECIES: hypothetical protein [Bacillus]MCI0768543.1 hypothetical protein [Bacillus sp. TL12]
MNCKKLSSYSVALAFGITTLFGFSSSNTQAKILNQEEIKNQWTIKSTFNNEQLKLIIKSISSEKILKAQKLNNQALSITESGKYSFHLETAISLGCSREQAQDLKDLFESFSPDTVKKIESVTSGGLKSLIPIQSNLSFSLTDLLTLLTIDGLKTLAKQIVSIF